MIPAPDVLGRGVVIRPGATPPPGFENAPRLQLDAGAFSDPAGTIGQLHHHWSQRRPLVVELHLSPQVLKAPEVHEVQPYLLDPSFELSRERLHFLLWANNYDATRGDPIWWHGRLATARLNLPAHPQAEVDMNGPIWCDGGPRGSVPFPVLHRESIEIGSRSLTLPLNRPIDSVLDPEQRAAVLTTGHSARVLAPAGSGKTRVLTSRFVHLLESGYEPSRLSALAYNRRAAQEMISRVKTGARSVRTLHSLGYSLLRRFGGNPGVASSAQVRNILRGLVKAAPQLNADPYAPYLEALQTVRLGLIDPEQIEAERDDVPGFARAFPRYRRRLAESNLVDHDEQIYGCIELLLRDPQARKAAQQECTHLLVDEFQDLTPAFLLLIRLLGAPSLQVFGVGDDDQVIYGYCGATPDYLVSFQNYFPGATTQMLATNYRCPIGVVDAAGNLLSRNKHRVHKQVSAASGIDTSPQLIMAPAQEWPSRSLGQINEWLTRHQPSEIAVLARVNAVLMPLQVLLRQQGIAHNKVVDESVLQRTGLRSALAYWRLCTQPARWSEDDLSDALRRPNRMLRREVIEAAARCRDKGELRRFARKQEPWPESQLEEFANDLDRLTHRAAQGPARFFAALRLETEFTTALDSLDSAGLGAAGSSHRDDLSALEALAALCDEPDFEEWLRGWLRGGESSDEGVRLSSVHRVKGLEWPCVLVYGVDQGLFPHRLAEDREEERRIFHVALTRSRGECALLGSSEALSPMIKELLPPQQKLPKKRKKKGKPRKGKG